MTSSLPRPPSPPGAAGPRSPESSSRAGVWVGVVLAIFGVVTALVWVGAQFVLLDRDVDDLERATAAVPLDFEVGSPVRWTLFLEPDEASFSGVRFAVTDTAAGTEVALGPYRGGFSYDTFSHNGRAVATISLDPGVYRLAVEGPVTIAIGPSPAGRVGWMVGGGLLIGAPLLIGGMALALVSAIRDTRRRTQAAMPPAPSPWTSGEWPQDPER